MNRLRGKAVLLLLLLGLYAASGSHSPLAAQEHQRQGLFGMVGNILISPIGPTVIALITREGDMELLATLETAISIPGRETVAIEDISVGDFLVVLAKIGDQGLEGEKILVKPTRPIRTTHVTGVVVESVGERLVIVDGEGHQLTISLGTEAKAASPGETVTAVVEQDLASGSLFTQGIEPADRNMQRLQEAIERASSQGATQNLKNLKARLVDSTTAHLTILQRVLQQVPAPAQAALNSALQRSTKAYQNVLTTFGLDRPSVRLAGVVEVVGPVQRLALLAPEVGEPVELLITDDTRLLLRGKRVGLEQLQVGHRIEATYDPETGEGQEVQILIGDRLQQERAEELLTLVGKGEVEGIAFAVLPTTTPPRLTLLTSAGETVTLVIVPQTRIKVDGITALLQRIVQNDPLKVLYNPSNQQAIQVETFVAVPGEASFQGVVQSFNRKTRELRAIRSDGKELLFNIARSAIIERDGRIVTISEIKLGDLIRPTTRYNTTTLEVKRFALKSAPPLPVQGIIRGKTSINRVDSLTISTDRLELVKLTITEATLIQRQGKEAGFQDLNVGERIVAGVYNPATLQAVQLVVQLAKSLQIQGIITALDADLLTISVTPEGRGPITLIVSKRSLITKKGNTNARFQDLAVGDQVRFAFYRAGSKEIVRLVII